MLRGNATLGGKQHKKLAVRRHLRLIQAAFGLEPLECRILLSNSVVVQTNGDDNGLATITNLGGGNYTAPDLRDAIHFADGASSPTTITFATNVRGPITLTSQPLEVDNSSVATTIDGPGAGLLTISGSNAFTVFEIPFESPAVTASISGLTITDGNAGSGGDGGGIFNDGGTLTLTQCTVSGDGAPGGYGGGIFNSGTLTANGCTIGATFAANGDETMPGNSALFGGGIDNRGNLTVTGGSISGDTATEVNNGGGINSSGPFAVDNVYFRDNTGSAISVGGSDNVDKITSAHFVDNSDDGMGEPSGGAIYEDGTDTLTINSSMFSGNSAYGAGAIEVYANGGGSPAVFLNVFNSTLEDNQGSFAGAVKIHGGTCLADIGGDTITGNTGGVAGGVLLLFGARAELEDCSISDNSCDSPAFFDNSTGPLLAGGGGGVTTMGSYLNVTGCTISADSIEGDGAGGILAYNSYTLNIQDSTIADNSASAPSGTTGCGGILCQYHSPMPPTVDIVNSTIAQNTGSGEAVGGLDNLDSSNTTLYNTIVAENIAGDGPTASDISGENISSNSAYNLIGSGGAGGLTNGTPGIAPGNIVLTGSNSPYLSNLGSYGGPTQTIALLVNQSGHNSPAIDAGSDMHANFPETVPDFGGEPLLLDQRGNFRIHGSRVDIGAYEYGSSTPASPLQVTSNSDALTFTSGELTLRQAVEIGDFNFSSTPTTITFASNVPGIITLTNGPLDISAGVSSTIDVPTSGLTLDGDITDEGTLELSGGDLTLVVPADGITVTGNFINQATLTLSGTVSDNTVTFIQSLGDTIMGGSIVNDVNLTFEGGTNGSPAVIGEVTGSGSLTIGDSSPGPVGYVQIAAGSGTGTQTALTINNGSTLDITNNSLAINYGVGNASPISTIYQDIQSGYNGGPWNGTGIISSWAAASKGAYGVGYADGSVDSGTPATAGEVLIKYTLYGDANLDGTVNLTDLLSLLNNYGESDKDWASGDFNYDGTVNLTDLLALLNNYGESVSSMEDPPPGDPTVEFVLVINGDGFGDYVPGDFAIYAYDSVGDNAGLAALTVEISGDLHITNQLPKGYYDDGTGDGYSDEIGFTDYHHNSAPLGGDQDTTATYGMIPVYGFGQVGGNLANDAPPGSDGSYGVVNPVYQAKLLVATGTFTVGSPPSWASGSNNSAYVFVSDSGVATEAANIVLVTETLT